MEVKGILEKMGLIEKVQDSIIDLENMIREKENMLNNDNHDINNNKLISEENYDEGSDKHIYKEDNMVEIKEKENAIHIDSNNALQIKDIYKQYKMDIDLSNSIFIIENFLGALPPFLAEENKREIVLKIVSSAGFTIDRIINDGEKRLEILHEYMRNFENSTQKNMATYEKEINKLSELIKRYNKNISKLKEENEKQLAEISAELERIIGIICFIKTKEPGV